MKYLFLILFIQNIYGANLVLDIGHTPKKNGATSSTCEQEYKYNQELALYILEQLKNKDNLKGKSKELLKIVKQKSESVKKDIESKISLPKNKLKVQKSETTNKKDIKPKRKI